jgi:DEAD/DEAH box helicase/Zn-finger in Ran binding protein and others
LILSGGGGGDNWTCEEGGCGVSNYPNRRQCFKCKASKPGGGGGGSQFDDPNNWTCEESGCGQNNFANRRQCFKCKANKPGGGGGYGGGSGGGSQFDNPDNWTCEESGCGQSNFPNRRQCYKCKANKPGGDSGFGASSQFDNPDNWNCPDSGCGVSNFANRRQCFKCKTDKPGGAGGDSAGGEVNKFDNPDNWVCDDPECAAKNFPSRRQCFKCQKERVGGPPAGANGDKPREFYIPPEPSNDEDVMFGGGISSGINFNKFDSIPVNVTGKDVPKAILAFENAGLKDFVLTNIKKSGYAVPTPIQKYAIPTIAAKRDLMACAQTGSGKTAAFLIPMIDMLLKESPDAKIGRPHVVIVSPTRELCIQVSAFSPGYQNFLSVKENGFDFGKPKSLFDEKFIQIVVNFSKN